MSDKLHTHEPDPIIHDKPFEESVQGRLCAQLRASGKSDLADAIQARAEEGKAKYGTYLFPFDGRDTTVDAAQEALDLVVYLAKSSMEGSKRDALIGTQAMLCAEFLVKRVIDDE